jgi:chromosome segregation ATPase
MSTATATATPGKGGGGVVQKVRSIFKELVDQEQAAVAAARQEYPRLLEMEDGDPKHVERMREVMRLLGKSTADLSADLEKIQQGRRLQQAVRNGSGLDAAREAAAKALEAHRAETARVVEELNRKHHELTSAETELTQRYLNAQKAGHDLRGLKQQNPDVLRYVEVPDLT